MSSYRELVGIAAGSPNSTNSSKLSKGRLILGRINIAFKLDLYTESMMRATINHITDSTLNVTVFGDHGTANNIIKKILISCNMS